MRFQVWKLQQIITGRVAQNFFDLMKIWQNFFGQTKIDVGNKILKLKILHFAIFSPILFDSVVVDQQIFANRMNIPRRIKSGQQIIWIIFQKFQSKFGFQNFFRIKKSGAQKSKFAGQISKLRQIAGQKFGPVHQKHIKFGEKLKSFGFVWKFAKKILGRNYHRIPLKIRFYRSITFSRQSCKIVLKICIFLKICLPKVKLMLIYGLANA